MPGAALGIFVHGGPKIHGVLGRRGTPTTLTKSLDLHDYHKCHRSTLGITDSRTPPPHLLKASNKIIEKHIECLLVNDKID